MQPAPQKAVHVPKPGDVPHAADCDICQFQIFGNRYKCLNCKDYDVCEFCENRMLELRQHNPQHVFLKFPLPYELESMPAVHVPNLHTGVLDDDTELSDDTEELQIDRKKRAEKFEDTSVLHKNVACDGCCHPIIGSRFCCINCPAPYNLCEACELKKIHPEDHVFAKIYFELPPHNTNIFFALPLIYKSKEKVSVKKNSRKTLNAQPEAPPAQRPPMALPTPQLPPPKIRYMRRDDIPFILIIEQESFCSPYEERFFWHFPHKNGCLILVAEVDEAIAGYVACQAKRSKLEIVSLAVCPHIRRRGVGFHLMQRGLMFGQESECQTATLHVSVFNFNGQELYKKLGFKSVGPWLENYYSSENEDALVMECPIAQKKREPSRLTDLWSSGSWSR